MNPQIVKWLLIAYMICIAILMATYYFLNLKKTSEKSFWENMGWWSLASGVIGCCAFSGMISPNTNANFICGCGSFIFLLFNGFYVALGKN
jgi:hypothetical protein